MSKALEIIKHELREAIFPATFFFFVFHIIALNRMLLLESYGMTVTSMTVATVAALIVAKAILIADSLPFIKIFSGKPLVYNIAWKTFIYGVLCFVIRCLEEIITHSSKYGGLRASADYLAHDFSWSHFWAVQIQLVAALAFYNTIVDLDRYFGKGSLKKALFGSAGNAVDQNNLE